LCDGDVWGESDSDIDELNDSSTSIGRSLSVFVGEGLGEEKYEPEGDAARGEDEKLMAARSAHCPARARATPPTYIRTWGSTDV
jgi:hypothetical protein